MAGATMAPFQLLVRGLDGRTLCLQFASPSLPVHHLKDCLALLLGIPSHFQRIVTGTRDITSQSFIAAEPDGAFPSCNVLLRLRGGKGGFGSLLRGAATKAGQKKTSNFDACRDMSGRRLRHVNAEKKLKEWNADAKERELEKTAEAFLKKHIKRKEEESGIMKELEKYRDETSKAMEEVESAVEKGLAAATKLGVDGKRKKVEAVIRESKRARIWMPFDESEELEDDDEDLHAKEHGENSKGLSTEHICSSGSETDMDNVDDDNELCFAKGGHGEGTSNEPVCSIDKSSASEAYCNKLDLDNRGEPSDDPTTLEEASHDICRGASVSEQLDKVPCKNEHENNMGDTASSKKNEHENNVVDTASSKKANTTFNEPLNWDDFHKAEELEDLGLDRLKSELQSRGLKCGGSLAERAARLFLLKTITIEKLDKKHFAKAKCAC